MTDIINPGQPDEATTTSPALGAVEHIDPHTLVIEANVRSQADLDAQFLASIKEHGVLVPIAAVRDADGHIRVRAGQRRTLAAREAGLSTVPVYVRPATSGDDAAELVQRVSEQIVENDQRRALTEVQRARGIQQMMDAGLSVTRVAKKLSVAKVTVKAAATAAKSATAMQALDEGQLSLAEAAALTEFEDMAGACERLLSVAGTRRFEHTVAQLRKERVSAQAQAQAEHHWRERGFTVLDERPAAFDADCISLGHLRTGDGEPADEQVITDPAHWAVLLDEDTALCDVDTGELVDEDTVDWGTEDRPDAEPEQGLRHANSVTETIVFVPEYFCLDYRAAGLRPHSWFARNAGLLDLDTGEVVDLDAEAREAARQRAEADKAEADKRERRKVLALNRLGDAALSVRREFVSKLLARKTPPKGAAVFVADCLARDSYLLTQHNALATTAEMLCAENEQAVPKLLADAAIGDGRAQVLTLALVLGACESRTPKDAWRNAAPSWGRYASARQYLSWLADNGYALSAVEEVITGATTADQVYDRYVTEAATKE